MHSRRPIIGLPFIISGPTAHTFVGWPASFNSFKSNSSCRLELLKTKAYNVMTWGKAQTIP